MPATLIYVHDPMCSWCYAFAPTWSALQRDLPAGVTVARLVGGLAPDNDRPMPPELRQKLQQTWRRVQQMVPGTEFNFAFWERCAPRRSTYPACRAVIAARRQGVPFEETMIAAIQRAYYREARNPSDLETLVALAAEIGLDADRFGVELASAETEAELLRQIALARRLGADGFPTLLLRVDDQCTWLPHDYRDYGPLLQQIHDRLAVANAIH